MANLFLVPVSNAVAQANIRRTMARAINPEVIKKHLQSHNDRLERIEKAAGGFYAWGVQPHGRTGTPPAWDQLAPGDYVAFYGQNASFEYVAMVLDKFRSSALARELWGEEEGETWEYMYFISKPITVNKPLLALSKYVGERVQGFRKVSSETYLPEILRHFNSVENFLTDPNGFAVDHSMLLGDSRLETELRWIVNANNLTFLTPGMLSSSSYYGTSVVREDREPSLLTDLQRRQGPPNFRKAVLQAYGSKCLVTGSKVVELVDAVQIIPYQGTFAYDVQNALTLRTDLHTLFDLQLLGIEPDSLACRVHHRLESTSYGKLDGKSLKLPPDVTPSKTALRRRWKAFRELWDRG